jgi:hypothetical protein
MHQRLLAFDLDGTLAENGIVPQDLQTALKHLRTAGYALFLVTGRRSESVALGPFGDVFAGIVWENGAVLSHAAANQVYLPSEPTFVVGLLETGTVSVMLDLCTYPVSMCIAYVAKLLRALWPLKERTFHPHWIVLEEAQDFLQATGSAASIALSPMLAGGGWAFVSYRADRLAGFVLAALNHHLLTCVSEPKALQTVGQALQPRLEKSPSDTPPGYVMLSGQRLVRLCSNSRRVPHIHHLYKYLDTPLPEHKRFYFHNHKGFLGAQAASLFAFLQCRRTVPVESVAYHGARAEFTAWVESTLGDGELAIQLHKLAHRRLCGEALRETLVQWVAARHREVEAMR